jgi:hypothetical protein
MNSQEPAIPGMGGGETDELLPPPQLSTLAHTSRVMAVAAILVLDNVRENSDRMSRFGLATTGLDIPKISWHGRTQSSFRRATNPLGEQAENYGIACSRGMLMVR